MKDSSKLFVGAAASIVLSAIWELIPTHSSYAAPSALAFLEHYHYGLASLLASKHVKGGKPYLQGFGIGMVAIESAEPNPFGIGKPPEQVVPNIALSATLLWLLVV